MWFLNLFQLISVRIANLICILRTESVQDPTKVEVDIIVEIVVFKKLKSVPEERGKISKGRAVIFVASLKKKEIKGKKVNRCQCVNKKKEKSKRGWKYQKEANLSFRCWLSQR